MNTARADSEQVSWSDRLAQGDPAALEYCFKRYAGVALAAATRILKDRAEAEEIVQQTFLEVWRRAGQYSRERGALGTWIATIARTRAIDRLRTLDVQAKVAGAFIADEETTSARTAADLLESARDEQKLRDAVHRLPAEQRKMVELAWFQGLTHPEIAEQTKTPLGTVKTRIRLGMLKLAEALRA